MPGAAITSHWMGGNWLGAKIIKRVEDAGQVVRHVVEDGLQAVRHVVEDALQVIMGKDVS